MATSNFFVVLSLSLTFFLVLLSKVNSTETLSFTFKKFKPNQPNLIFQGDALATSSGKLQLTKVDESGAPAIKSLGRALYTTPVQIWDGETGNIASLASSFSVIVKVPENSKSADGFAFFLAPIDSQPQNKSGFLGLFNGEGYNRSLQTVAVEFDTYKNAWDPQNPRHIGIDVNSVKSIKTQPWGLANGQVAKILITYDASTTLLAASLIHPSRRTSYILAEKVDLKSVLPEWVRIGFSATTGSTAGYTETHDVLSWSFASKLSEYSTSDDLDLASFMMHEAI